MKQDRDFHRQVRVVYRACRRIYGIEYTQDECLRVFKIVFPELYKLQNGDCKTWTFSDETKEHLKEIVSSWKPAEWLKKVTDYALCRICNHSDEPRHEVIQFCIDILPVVMRIRKLTPTETGRLMGMRDDEIQKMYDAGLSNSAMYRLHGNSIVVDVMTALFDKMFVNTDQEKVEGTQLSLF